ncbi:acetyl/propionyl/methylcrotonyl-CoA carboxylase subunit alpha [soil metagenome]
MFDTVLIANRGEIACRVIGTLRTMGVRSVAVYSDADSDSKHVQLADVAVRIGPANVLASYLNVDAIIAAARETGAQAIHPGYGFLAENASFAAACEQVGLVFIGPSPRAIEIMGDKISAKAQVTKRGVPTVPGLAEPGLDDERLAQAAIAMGFPVLIKPSAGGGGKGMHVVTEAGALTESLAAARREAASSFGNDAIFIERYISRPRHIEVQVLADSHGNVIHLGERECSLQRRHQKVIEEAPSPLLDESARSRIGEAACETARSVGYQGVGTVEFIVSADEPDEFYFMEMNTRLQVEHPVTEMITGIDLVQWQVRVAAGEQLDIAQTDVRLSGHSIEARIYAEDPQRGFLPTGGRIVALNEPSGAGIRVDSALVPGLVISSDYDPMLAKVITWAPERDSALAKLISALSSTSVLGVSTNIEFLTLLLSDPRVRAAELDTGLIERAMDSFGFAEPSPAVFARAALVLHAIEWGRTDADEPWGRADGWRVGARSAPSVYRLKASPEAETTTVSVWGEPSLSRVRVGDEPESRASVRLTTDGAQVRIGDVSTRVRFAQADDRLLLSEGPVSWQVTDTRTAARVTAERASAPELRSPMPGSVVAISARDGQKVSAGEAVVIVEAMKMEHVLRATEDGIVALHVVVGAQVTGGELLATVAPGAAPPVDHHEKAAAAR